MADDIKCPICGAATTLRTAKKGSSTGEQFYVCGRYPECKGKVKYQTHSAVINKSNVESMMGSISSDIQWLAKFEFIRSKAAPVMSQVSRASGGNDKDLLGALSEATQQLPILLQAMQEIPEPSKEEYKKSREDMLKGLESYIQGCQSHIQWVETRKSMYLSKGLACFDEATKKFDSATRWLLKSE